MRRTALIAIAIAVAVVLLGGLALSGCERTVSVETGERVLCTYDHLVSEDIRTIEVPADEADQYGVKTREVVCEEHQRAQRLYEEAQAAIRARDLKAAQEKLASVVVIDRAFKQAQTQLDAIKAGRTPTPDPSVAAGAGGTSAGSGGTSSGGSTGGGSSGSTPAKPGDDAKPTGPIASLTGWMPDDIAGYKAATPIADALAVSREYLPQSGDRVDSLVIAAEQMGSPQMVSSALEQDVKLRYSVGGKAVTVNGRKGWLGTDGRQFAVLGLADGPVLVVLEMSSTSVAPSKLTGDLQTIAKTLPR